MIFITFFFFKQKTAYEMRISDWSSDVCSSDLIKALYDYWQSIRPNDLALPGRRHFDPLDIPELLPNIWMLDVKRDPLRFRFRLIGIDIVRFTGRDSTGQWLDEVYPGYAADRQSVV